MAFARHDACTRERAVLRLGHARCRIPFFYVSERSAASHGSHVLIRTKGEVIRDVCKFQATTARIGSWLLLLVNANQPPKNTCTLGTASSMEQLGRQAHVRDLHVQLNYKNHRRVCAKHPASMPCACLWTPALIKCLLPTQFQISSSRDAGCVSGDFP